MSRNKANAAFLLIIAAASSVFAAGESVCPLKAGQPPRYVDLFDGEPSELATVVPDVAKARQGHWQVGYVYDANRSVTIRCKYADKQLLDVKLTRRVDRCEYLVDARGVLAITCR